MLDAALTDRDGRRRSHSIPPGALKYLHGDALRKAASLSLAPVFQRLLLSTKEPFMQVIQDYQAPKMVFGRAILLGDAAFVARPHTGAGAGKAAANALALGKALRDTGTDIDIGLATWQQSQWAEGKRMAQWGMSLGSTIMGL
jgi:2-polyprenyl-6-methoxyphenol hydroxylase-like FAD-dependent oxidoreductase